jgi:hypothetical protein
MRKVVVALVVLTAAFLIGFVPEWMSARQARSENVRLRLELDLARLQGKLGRMSYEANRNNFGNASALSTEFFNGLKSALADPLLAENPGRKAKLEGVAGRRDEVTADLARADPAVKDTLAAMYMELSTALSGP